MIGGLEKLAPLDIEDERRLYPVIAQGRVAADALERDGANDQTQHRRLLRQRHAGQEAESLLLRATLGLVRMRVVERGYRFGNEELEAAGIEGLVNALRRFEPGRGARFSTYANYWIMKLVNQAVQQQAGLSDSEMRLILKLQKMERAEPNKRVSKREAALYLGVTQSRAQEVMQLSRELQERRFETADISDELQMRVRSDRAEAPSWVIDELRGICGADFDAFWQFTFRTMPIEEIARAHGITRQGMSKRIQRSRRLVRDSPGAERLEAWFDQQ